MADVRDAWIRNRRHHTDVGGDGIDAPPMLKFSRGEGKSFESRRIRCFWQQSRGLVIEMAGVGRIDGAGSSVVPRHQLLILTEYLTLTAAHLTMTCSREALS
uniref:Uncharacterized protein n=1 Tax=Triticum urartu TaxID=4572 RepID=A0A8R7P243_TRIUA